DSQRGRRPLDGVEALGQAHHCLVAAVEDLLLYFHHPGYGRAGRSPEPNRFGGPRGSLPLEAARPHPEVASRSFAVSSSTSAPRSLWATRLATKRAVHSRISSRTSRSFSSRVRPVATRSTIPSPSPISGASS